jgi:hypothetical protein
MHPKYARLVRRSVEPQNINLHVPRRGQLLSVKKPFFLKPKFLRRALGVLILLVAISWSFQYWMPSSNAFAAPWSSIHGSYGQRKQLTLVNNSGQTFESGTTYKVTIDTQSLYNTGSVLSTCDDLRVVYQPSDTTAVELKRAVEYASSSSGVTTCGTSSATKVVFQLQANIANTGTDANYYLYYDNATATTYPATDALAAYNVGSKTATFVAPFNGTTTALAAGSGTPTTATGAIRYTGGKGAMSFDGVNDAVSVAGNSSLPMSTSGDSTLTLEAWVYTTTWDQNQYFIARDGTARLYELGISNSWANDGRVDFIVFTDALYVRRVSYAGAVTKNQWTHIAGVVDRATQTMDIYINGVKIIPESSTNQWGTNFITSQTEPLTVGRRGLDGTSFLRGSLDEVRISNTVRYTSNFTPSTTPFVRDDNTKLLLHFDENGDDPRNTGKVIDDSGNGNHGTITGAKYVGGLVGVDGSTTSNASTGYQASQSYAGHEGVFIEEGTTNKITNPSFDHTTYNTNWAATQTYTQEDQFTTARAGGAVNGTSAEPTGGTRTAIDTNSKISITGGQLSFATGEAANDGVWYPVQTRAAGKLLSATITPADTNGDILFGWDTNQMGAITDALKFTAAGVLQIVPNGGTAVTVGNYTATSYQIASVMRATGIYWFIKGGTYTTWTQLFSTSAGNASMYPAVQAGNSTAVFTLDNMRIPTATWLPTPLAYDSFTRADGAIGSTETTGPDSQVVPQLAWTGSTWTVSGNKIINNPNLGTELVANNSFETGNPPTSWGYGGTPVTFEQSSTQAQAGTYSLHLVTDGNNELGRHSIMVPSTGWYASSGHIYPVTSSNYHNMGLPSSNFVYLPLNQWRQLRTVGRATAGAQDFVAGPTYADEMYIDNVSLKSLTLNELFTTLSTTKSNISAEISSTVETAVYNTVPSGMVLRLDNANSPQNFILAYIRGLGANSWGRFVLEKCINGTYTTIIATDLYTVGSQYVAGTRLRVTLSGSSVSAYYGNVLLGTGTVSDAGILNNTIHGALSTYSGDSEDNFTLFPLGNGGENASIPVEPTEFLTATENSAVPYYKFGSKSVKLVDTTNATRYATSINPGNTNTHTLSAYVYDGTTGNIGGTVSSSITKLVFNGTTVTPSAYTDVGGGWWRLSYSATTANAIAAYGVEVQVGKTIYVDGVQLEEKAYATTYADGTMGTGYTWTGTANDSTSTRDFAKTAYQTGNLPDNTKGSISFWVRPLGNRNTIVGCYDNNYIGLTSGGNMGVYIQTKGNLTGLKFTGRNNSGTWYESSPTNGILAEGVWSHLVLTWDASSVVLYKNGSSYSSYGGALPTTFSNPSLYVGYAGDTCPSTGLVNIPSNSSITSVNVYSDSLSSVAVQDLYYSGLGSHSSLAPVATERYTDGEPPVLAWHLNEGYGTTAYDSTIFQNSGTTNGPIWSDDSGQIGGKSLKFDGINDFISRTYTNDPELNPGTSAFSVSTWFKHPSTVTGTDTLISRYSSTGSGGGYKVYLNSSGFICFGVDDDTTWGPDESACTTVSYADSNWHHVLAIKGTSTIAVYIDGTQKASTVFTVSSSLSGASPTFFTGIDSDGASNPWDGFIDEVRVYNSARSEEQINQEYIAKGTNKGVSAQFGNPSTGSGQNSLSQGLVGFWKMDEASWNGTAGEVLDASGNGNNGVRFGDATIAAGKFGNGGTFDGTGDYVSVTRTSSIDPQTAWSLAAWVKRSITGTMDPVLEMYDWSDAKGNFAMRIDNDRLIAYIINGVTSESCGTTSTIITQGVWYLLSAVYDSKTKTLSCYINGVSEATNRNIAGIPIPASVSLKIGARGNDVGEVMNGQLDEARIYNRALSPAEVRSLYEYAPGPVAHYTFDEGSGQSAYDKSGNSNTGTLGASASPASDDPTWTNGKYGKALSFDGSDDYVDVVDSDVYRPTKALTVSTWFKAPAQSDYKRIISTNSTANVGYDIHLFPSGAQGKIQFDIGTGSQNSLVSTTTGLGDNKWHYVSGTWDGQTMKLYIDGNQEASGNLTGTITYSSTYLALGSTGSFGSLYNGAIDDVRIYNYARTQKQIVMDMNAGHPAVGSPVGSAVAHYKFDEGQGTVAQNSGNGGSTLNGALTNMSAPATSTSGWTNDGKFNKALNFDGSDDYVTINNQTLGTTDQLTISGWIKHNGKSSANQDIVVKRTSLNNDQFEFMLSSTYNLTFDRYLPTGGSVSSNNTIPLAQWKFVTVTLKDTENEVRFYIDGKLDSIKPYTETYTGDSTSTLTIGRSGVNSQDGTSDPWRNFNGSIDEVKIYNYALSEDEVKLEYNQGKAIVMGSLGTTTDGKTASNTRSRAYCPPGNIEGNCADGLNAAPVAEWNFDSGSGQSAPDTSGNNNTGQLGLTSGVDASDPTWTNGKTGKGLSFDGNDDRFLASRPTITSTISVCLWAKWRSVGTSTSNIQMLVDNNHSSSPLQGFVIQDRPDLSKHLTWSVNPSGNGAESSSQVGNGLWHYICGTNNGSVSKLYVDGIQDGTANETMAILQPNVSIGYWQFNPGRYLNGLVDQVKIYNYARTPAQIAWDYNKGAPLVQYKLNECSGTTINNSVPNANAEEAGNNSTLTIGASGTQTLAGTCASGNATEAWNNGTSGKISSSISFDGADDYVRMSSRIIAGGDFSISTWFKATNIATSQWLVTQGQLSVGTWLGFIINSSKLKNESLGIAGSTTLLSNTWYHAVLVYNSADGKEYIYLNGYLDGSGSIGPTYTGDNVTIGGNPSTTPSGLFAGQIDDVRIFNYALSPVQVRDVYNNGAVSFK